MNDVQFEKFTKYVDSRFDEQEKKIDSRFEEQEKRLDKKIDSRFEEHTKRFVRYLDCRFDEYGKDLKQEIKVMFDEKFGVLMNYIDGLAGKVTDEEGERIMQGAGVDRRLEGIERDIVGLDGRIKKLELTAS